MNDVFKIIKNAQKLNENFVLATILEKYGSAPRREGAKMLIWQDLSINGTIGGGLVEAMVIKEAAKVHQNKEYRIEEFCLSNKAAASMGMVCGGDVKIILEYIDWQNEKVSSFFDEMYKHFENKTDFIVVTRIPQKEDKTRSLEKWVSTETSCYGTACNEVQCLIEEIHDNFGLLKYRAAFLNKDGYYVEPYLRIENICIFGGGHIGKVLADLCKVIGLYVTVVDDREEFANTDRFSTVDEVIVLPGFEEITDRVRINSQSYVVIVTRGHSYDKEVLAQMLQTKAKYIGMIGSRTKREHVYQGLLEEGFTNSDLERVYSPIGLPIHADTPEEIAVSILAEMIQNEKRLQI
jgi:xanthine dehydrogenase accessory factor